ncbi:MxaK protein [Methylococcus sp. ANG]|uniref:MxaK protein n=1 Tax=unclassified Methylococcus TaxID=2618889 RepID=UPI001C52A690|nr:MxaK protein [Methylococcus sp. Mc7]QXP83519.1 MxaK protein [Methylococcus sp. Mc7]
MVTKVKLRESAASAVLVLGLGITGWSGYQLFVVARENAAIDDPRNVSLDEDTAPEVVLAKAQALDLGGDYQEALRLYHTIRNDPVPAFRQRVHYNMGTIYLREAAGLWNARGVLEYARVNALVAMAKENLKEALRLNPDDQDARFNLEYAFRITPPPKEKEKANWQGTKSSVFSTLPGIPGGGP